MNTWPELPVDLPRKSEIVQSRVGFIILVSVLLVVIFILFLLSVEMGFVLAKGAAALPDIRLLENWRPNESTRIFDRNGALVANIHGDEDRVVVPLSDISPNMPRAVMAIEDNRFYQHSGIDIRGTLRALVQNLKKDDVQGGSTVTQQLVKNLFLSPERSIGRKLAEAILSVRVEKVYSKNKILEMYLNQVYWGNQAYGIEKAARRYFKKSAKELTIAESALLAGLLKAPEGLSPFTYPEAARKRQLEVMDKMVEFGYITTAMKTHAVQQKIVLNTQKAKASKHPYFVAYVIQELESKFGDDVVRRGGLKVYTSMDEAVQSAAEKALIDNVTGLPSSSMVQQGALVALDNQTAEVLAMVGGVDFNKSQFNMATQSRRAAGSSFKPFVYLTGFRLGVITPETPISDRPVYFNTGVGTWSPHNWDHRFMGPMNIRKALTLSRNTTTVQVGMKVGIDEVIKTATLAGITSPIDRNFSSLLGSSGFSPMEIATAYSTFARGGVRMSPTAIRRIEDSRGQPVAFDQPVPERVFDPEPVASLVSILTDVVEKGTGKNARLLDADGKVVRRVAGKTGTTDNVRDIWFTGFTSDMTACVWMGNTKYVPLHGVFSSNTAKTWHDFAEAYYKIRLIPPMEFETAGKLALKQATQESSSSVSAPLNSNATVGRMSRFRRKANREESDVPPSSDSSQENSPASQKHLGHLQEAPTPLDTNLLTPPSEAPTPQRSTSPPNAAPSSLGNNNTGLDSVAPPVPR
jgi:penicillin-binding protein 1A